MPPIGFVSVDVDQYVPTVAILEMLQGDDKHFLPIVSMYFDDVHDRMAFQGECLAISEFNKKSKTMKISPETMNLDWISERSIKHLDDARINSLLRCKELHRFEHPLYSTTSRTQCANLSL
jgi:hypothetical protein